MAMACVFEREFDARKKSERKGRAEKNQLCQSTSEPRLQFSYPQIDLLASKFALTCSAAALLFSFRFSYQIHHDKKAPPPLSQVQVQVNKTS